ncbi:hypothetical protein HDU96_003065, partial [Phlyctochytrium bullatum]
MGVAKGNSGIDVQDAPEVTCQAKQIANVDRVSLTFCFLSLSEIEAPIGASSPIESKRKEVSKKMGKVGQNAEERTVSDVVWGQLKKSQKPSLPNESVSEGKMWSEGVCGEKPHLLGQLQLSASAADHPGQQTEVLDVPLVVVLGNFRPMPNKRNADSQGEEFGGKMVESAG